MLTPAVAQYNHGYIAPKADFAKNTPALAFTAGIKPITNGNVVFLDAQNFHLYLPDGVNHEAITGHLRGTIDRVGAHQVLLNQWFLNLPAMWQKSFTDLRYAKCEQRMFLDLPCTPAVTAPTESTCILTLAGLTETEEKVQGKETIHAAMEKIKAFVDETLEYLRKNSKVS
ncbi:MAG: hypothetical protein V4482_00450 [Pseudomonadota bacterium]